MTYLLDLKDRKILYELDKNSRQTSSQIAKQVGLSQEVVNYRIKKLEEEKIITQYLVVINMSKLGIYQFKILLSFQHMKSSKLNEIIEKLNKNKNVKWLASCKGSWDLVISFETNDFNEIDIIKDKTLALFEGHISKKAISIAFGASVYNRDFLLDNKHTPNRERILVNSDRNSKLDEVDLEILKKLAENARKSLVDIAHELKTSARIVNYRINQMIKNKVITGFRVALNYEKLGIQFYKAFIYLDNPKQERLGRLVNYFENNKNIIHHVKVLGNWDLEPEFEVYSEEEFNSILKDIKDQFSDIIKTVEVITIDKEHKFVYL